MLFICSRVPNKVWACRVGNQDMCDYFLQALKGRALGACRAYSYIYWSKCIPIEVALLLLSQILLAESNEFAKAGIGSWV